MIIQKNVFIINEFNYNSANALFSKTIFVNHLCWHVIVNCLCCSALVNEKIQVEVVYSYNCYQLFMLLQLL